MLKLMRYSAKVKGAVIVVVESIKIQEHIYIFITVSCFLL